MTLVQIITLDLLQHLNGFQKRLCFYQKLNISPHDVNSRSLNLVVYGALGDPVAPHPHLVFFTKNTSNFPEKRF